MARKKLQATQTPQPQVPLSKPIPVLSDELRTALGATCFNLIDINLGNRAALDNSLDIWNAILEMRSQPMNLPWDGASHIVTPTVFTAYNEFCSRVIGSCLQPRPYTVRGTDPISAYYAPTVEQFANAEWEQNDCFDSYEEAIRLAARDGTVIMEVLYDLSTHEERFVVDEPVVGADGNPAVDALGNPITERKTIVAKFIDYDAPREVPVDLKSFVLLPNFSTTVNAAPGVARKLWMVEQDLWKKVGAGVFNRDSVEKVIQYVSTGQGQQSQDPQGNSQYTISGMINVVDNALAPPEGIAMSSGPFHIFRFHTDLFDLDGDGVPEENIIWLHYESKIVLGAVPYDYLGGRPFFPLTLIPRPGVAYGFAIPEIGRPIQEENDTQTNARLNLLDLAVKPQRWRTSNVRYNNTDNKWDPNTEILVSKKDDFGFVDPPNIPEGSMIEQNNISQLLDRAIGSPQTPAMGVPVGGNQQRSARAVAVQAQLMAMNSNLVNTRVRRWMLRIFRFKMGLYLRYGKNQLETVQQSEQGPQRMTLPKEVIGLNYQYGVTGLGGALDKEQRRQDMAMLTQLLLQTPLAQLFQGKLTRLWNLARLNLETYDVPDITTFIGTLDEAQQTEQAMAQQAKSQAQVAALMQVLSHQPAHGGPGGGGAPSPPAAPPGPTGAPAALAA